MNESDFDSRVIELAKQYSWEICKLLDIEQDPKKADQVKAQLLCFLLESITRISPITKET